MIRISLLLALAVAPASAREGFFSPTAYTALNDSGISAKTIAGVLPSVGAFLVQSESTYTWKEIESLRSTRCSSDVSRAWNQEFCKALAAADCTLEGSCRVQRTSSCGGVAVSGFFVTARHCTEGHGDRPAKAKFISPDGLPILVELEKTALTEHAYSDDLALLRIPNHDGKEARIRRQEPKDGEPVFGVGFPYFRMRGRKRADYTAPWGEPRVALGKVVDGNSKSLAICNFSNQSDDWKNTWKWEETCPEQTDETPEFREERHLFLTDNDMLNGMSGSPLFDKRGRLLGIGTNTLKKAPYDYDAKKPALYVKAERIQALIGELANAEKRLKAETEALLALEQLQQARLIEREGRWEEAEAAFVELKTRYGKLPYESGNYADLADASLRFLSCETGRDRPRRTFPRIEYLESVALSALSDGSRERLLHLLPCRVVLDKSDLHAEELVNRLLERRISGAPPDISVRERIENRIEATLIGVSGAVVLIWERDGNGGWAFIGARLD